MFSWISHLDPNLALTLLSAIGGGLVWLYRDVTGQKQESLTDLATGAARSVWTGILGSYTGGSVTAFQALVQGRVTSAIWTELQKHGVSPTNTVAQLMVNTVVQTAVADATDALNNAINAQVQRSLDSITKSATATQEMLKTPGAIPVAVIPTQGAK